MMRSVVPNFIRPESGDSAVDVADLDRAALDVIADAWHRALIAHAAERREARRP